jgi:Ca-activated chloride channel homolog
LDSRLLGTVHYVDIAKDFAHEWCQYGVPFASAAYMQETTLVGFQQKCVTKLRAVYVTDFPFVADYPYIVLTGPWVSGGEKEAAEVFGVWLDERLRSDAKVRENGFRREDIVPDTASGADPNQPSSPPPLIPDAPVLKAMQQGWPQLRRPANVMLVVDESQAMASEGKEELAKEALAEFLTCPGEGLEADDKVGMVAFGGDESEIPIADFDLTRSRLEATVGSLAAQGKPALWDAMERALQDPALHEKGPVNTIILLTNGTDNSSSTTPEELEAELVALRDRHRPVQVLVAPYGADATSAASLQKHLVSPSLGRYFHEDVSDIAVVKQFICAFQ